MKNFRASALLILLGLATAGGVEGRAASILNGDFSISGSPPDPFLAWTTTYPSRPTNGGGFAVFDERAASNSIELEQTMGSGIATSLSFEFKPSSAGTPTGGLPPDSFQASLIDANSGNYLFSINSPSFLAFYSVDATGMEFKSSRISTIFLANGYERVTLALPSLSTNNVILEFVLNSVADGRGFQVSLDNVVASGTTFVPEPSSLTTFALGILCMIAHQARAKCASRGS